MKIYEVTVYKVDYLRYFSGKFFPVDKIIVKKRGLKVQEILTGYSKFSVIP